MNDVEVDYLGNDTLGDGRVYAAYAGGKFKGGFVLDSIIVTNKLLTMHPDPNDA